MVGAAPMRQYSGGGAQSWRSALGRGYCQARSDSRGRRSIKPERGPHRVIHTPHDFLRSASGAEVVVSKLERLALK